MCLDALLLRRPPWCLSTRLAPGVSPFSARDDRDRLCLSARHPLLCLAPTGSPQAVSEDTRCGHRHAGPVRPARLHSRGFIPLSPGSTAAGFLRWPRLPRHSWVSSSLRHSPPVPGTWPCSARQTRLSEDIHARLARLDRLSLAAPLTSEDAETAVRS